MKYKLISDLVVARIDDDGLSRLSCSVEDAAYLAWLAEGNTPEPADPAPAPDIIAQIEQLERETLLPRVTREFMLHLFAAQATAANVDPMENFGYRKVKELDDQIAALRTQMA